MISPVRVRVSRRRSLPAACCPWAMLVRFYPAPVGARAKRKCGAVDILPSFCVAADDTESGELAPQTDGPPAGSNPMKPGEGIDPANYTGAGDSEYFKKQFQKQQKRNAKKADAGRQAHSSTKLALGGAVTVAAAGLFFYTSDNYTPSAPQSFPPDSLGAQLALEANHGWLLVVALFSTVLLQYAAMEAAAVRRQCVPDSTRHCLMSRPCSHLPLS